MKHELFPVPELWGWLCNVARPTPRGLHVGLARVVPGERHLVADDNGVTAQAQALSFRGEHIPFRLLGQWPR